MTCVPENTNVAYISKDLKQDKIFDALKWIAAIRCQLQHRGKQSLSHPVVEE